MFESNCYCSIDYNLIKQIKCDSKDFQEKCLVKEKPNGKTHQKTVSVYYNFFGYDSQDDLDKAYNILQNAQSSKAYKNLNFKKYHEGDSLIDVTLYPKESYLFYNSL